ncbi:MAG: hypothetical protein PVG05_08650 [Gammaproteobacteria bacterium]|jgi:hypothetical protein
MKRFLSGLLLACCAVNASAYHSGINETTTAEGNASCNAAFHSGCPEDGHDDGTETASSSGSAAPFGALGSSPLEMALIALLLGGLARRGRANVSS